MDKETYAKMFDLKGKVALITGSSKGIGLAIAWQMARAGASVIISSRKKDACDQVSEMMLGEGLSVKSIPCNVGVKEEVEELVKNTRVKFGNIDILVCNAATNPVFGSLSSLPDQAFEKLVKVNIQSTLWLSQLVIPQMVESGGGSIILLSSIAAIRGNAFIGAYGMTKAAESALARNLAVEYGPSNVRVNAIAPGPTIKNQRQSEKHFKKQYLATPLKRQVDVEQICNAVDFFIKNRSITGQVLAIDSGQNLNWQTPDVMGKE